MWKEEGEKTHLNKKFLLLLAAHRNEFFFHFEKRRLGKEGWREEGSVL